MPQSKEDKRLIAWLRRIQAVPRPVQPLLIAFLKLRNPILADRLQPIVASQGGRNSILDVPMGRVFEAALPSEESGLLPAHTDPGAESTTGAEAEGSAARPTTPRSWMKGERIGPWRIERLIGSGGMGSVYEAWRDDGQYEQKVALKCIRNDRFSAEMTQAFLSERNALAKLQHKGIVPLLDGGIDSQGSPWFVMRYVDGEPIDSWCDRHKTSIRSRIKLVVQACEALAYASRPAAIPGS